MAAILDQMNRHCVVANALHIALGAGLLDRFGDELCRSIGDLLQSPLECVAVAGRQDIGQAAGEIERVRRQLFVNSSPRGCQRQKRLPHIGTVDAPGEELAFLQKRNRARYLGLMHMGVRADRFAGHDPELAERDQHSPFRDADPVTAGVYPRQRFRYQSGDDIELVRQELLKLQRRSRHRRTRLGSDFAAHRVLTAHWTKMNEVAEPRNAVCRALHLTRLRPKSESRRELLSRRAIQGCREKGLAFNEAGTWSSKSSAA